MARNNVATGPSPDRVPIGYLDAAITLALDGREVVAGIHAATQLAWQIKFGFLDVRDEEHYQLARRAAFMLIDTANPVHVDTGMRITRLWSARAGATDLSLADVPISGCSPPWQLSAACLLAGAEHRLDNHRRALDLTRPHLHDLELLRRSAAAVPFPDQLRDLWRLDHLTSDLRDPASALRRPAALLLKIMLPATRASLPLTSRQPSRAQMLAARAKRLDPLIDSAVALLTAGYSDLIVEEAHGLSCQLFFALCERRAPADGPAITRAWQIDRATRPRTIRSQATAWLLYVAHAQWRGDADAERHYTRVALQALQDAGLRRHVEAILRRGWLQSRAA